MALSVAVPAAGGAEVLFSDVPTATLSVEDTRGLALGDVDQDGDLDLVRAGVEQATTLHLNQDGALERVPAWSGPVERTRCVALGDVDGDGDLDLVLGNSDQGATLYRNTGGTFADVPAWGGVAAATRAIALADLDGDGDLDLVLGNLDQGSHVYRNAGGTFEATPSWTGPVASTNAVALGDVDGDGRVDLVLGNFDQPALLFLNSATGFEAVPDWSGPAEPTRGVALGDVDGDGDFDLVRGNLGAGTTLTLNEGGRFAAAPIWTAPAESTWAVALGDVDGDGRLDLARGTSARGTNVLLGDGAAFTVPAAWTGPAEETRSLALGDLDGDGDLDLVRGNFGQATTVYRNVTSPLAPVPAWTGPVEDTRAAALGDVDGDGDLDLVRGNHGQGATLYLNDGGTFAAVPAWTGPVENTVTIALGDVDGDGDLDLVRGNFDQGATLYLNDGGTFAAAPAWTGPAENTTAVALADLDRDGDLDLVRGNFDQGATVYPNLGGSFAATPSWTGPVESTRAIAIGDVDGDGWLDLVRGNAGAPSTLVLGSSAGFGDTPAWLGPPEQTTSVALADLDGDGNPDLVRGNLDQGATLTFNDGFTFYETPAWTGPVESTVSVALGDVDGDGDLDLARANLDEDVTLYLNRGFAFDLSPAGAVGGAQRGALALGDVDRDGDLDVVAGGAALHANRSPWLEGGVPSRRLPDGAAHLRRVATAAGATNQIRIAFAAADAESDPTWVAGEFQFEGAPFWTPIELAGGGRVAGPFTTSPAGVSHEIVWDVTRIPFDPRDLVIRLTTHSSPRRGGPIALAPAYLHETGRVIPRRPSLIAAPDLIIFPAVTVGDTAEETMQISNLGTEPLVITQIETPAPEIIVRVPPGLTVAPGETRDVAVKFAPRGPLPQLDPIVVHANDPAKPTALVALSTPVRELEFTTQLLAVAPKLPLGESATVLVTPAPEVRLESGYLFFRSRGSPAFTDSSRLVPQGASFIALVPSLNVTEAGLEYWVRVENSGFTRTDPKAAPDSVYFHPVGAPEAMELRVAGDIGGEFVAGRDLQVLAGLPSGAQFVEGTLYFRAGGRADWDSVEFAPISTLVAPVAVIPGDSVGPRGIEYWGRVTTLTTTLTDPPHLPRQTPRTQRITVISLSEPVTHAGRRFRLVSVPLVLALPPTTSIEAVLSDQPEFGPPDPTRWRAFRWDPGEERYLEVTTGAGDPRLHPEPGRAFWLVAAEANAIDTAPVPGVSTPTGGPYSMTLAPGWNMIGNPFTFPVAWRDSMAFGTGGRVTPEPPVAWDPSLARYRDEDVTVLVPFEGYWLFNPKAEPLTLAIPPQEAVAVAPAGPAAPERTATNGLEWRLRITASCGDRVDARNFAGVAAGAGDGSDGFDRADPPPGPSGDVTLYFLDAEDAGGPARTVDVRGPRAQGAWRWSFDVARRGAAASAEDARLEVAGLDALPAELEARVVDRALGRVLDPRVTNAYAFVSTRRERVARADEARFELIVGTPADVAAALEARVAPTRTRFSGALPSPMAGDATLRFEIPRADRVRIEAFDASGRRVARILDEPREPGAHEVRWVARSASGTPLAPGVYLLRLAAAGQSDVLRVVKLQ